MDPLPLAQNICNKHSGSILHNGRCFLQFDEKYKLWRDHPIHFELFNENDIPAEYKHATKMYSFRTKVLKELKPMSYNQSKLELMDTQHHLLPIADGLVIDTLEGSIRDRTKDDYFTYSTELRYLDDDDLYDAEKYFRSLVSTDSEYHNMLRVLGELLFGQTFGTKGVIIAGGRTSVDVLSSLK